MKVLLITLFAALLSFQLSAQGPNGLDFDGINDYVQSNYNGISGSGARTVECWVKTTANCVPTAGGLQNVLVDWGTFVTAGRFTLNILWNNAIRIETGGDGLSGTTPINDGMWHHVAAVYDPFGGNNKFRLYVDGSLETQGNISVGINSGTATKVRIGRRVDGVNYFDGSIDEVRIWNVAKTSSQIAALMDNEICFDATGLQFYYTFNQGTAAGNNVGESTVYDQANAYDGNLIGFSYVGGSSNWVDGAPVTGSSFQSIPVTSCTAYTLEDGTELTTSGSYSQALASESGCDSLVTLDFTYLPIQGDTLEISSCDAYTAPSGQVLELSGQYEDLLSTPEGCDSLVTIFFELAPVTTTDIELTQCSSYTDNVGFVHTESGTITEIHTAQNGCDSLVNIDLEIIPAIQVGLVADVCEGGSFQGPDGAFYTEEGLYTFNLTSSAGCDSIVTLELGVFQLPLVLDWVDENWTVIEYAEGASFQWWTCDGALLSGQNSTTLLGMPPGEYYVTATFLGCIVQSDCVEVSSTSDILPLADHSVVISPNPARLTFSASWNEPMKCVELINVRGMLQQRWDVPPGALQQEWRLQVPAGSYILHFHAASGRRHTESLLVN